MYDVFGAAMNRYGINGMNFGGAAGADNASGTFGNSLKSLLNGQGGIEGALDRLRDRFPGLAVKEETVKPGVQGAEEDAKAVAGDLLTVESAAFSAIAGNTDLAAKVEKAIDAFMNGAGTTPSLMQGAYVQRTVSVTVTTIRFSAIQRSAETGDMLAGSELSTSLHDAIQELVNRFFGKDGAEDSDASSKEGEKSDVAEENAEAGASSGGYSFAGAMWSMELYYSSTYIQAMGGNGGLSGDASETWGYQAGFSGVFSQFSGSLLPQALFDGFSGTGQGPFTSLLSGMGMALDGVSQMRNGYLATLRESRNLLAELLEFQTNRTQAGAGEKAESAEETEAAEVMEEVAAQ